MSEPNQSLLRVVDGTADAVVADVVLLSCRLEEFEDGDDGSTDAAVDVVVLSCRFDEFEDDDNKADAVNEDGRYWRINDENAGCFLISAKLFAVACKSFQ